MASLKFDGNAFKRWMYENGLNQSAVASRIYRSRSAANLWIKRGEIGNSSYAALLKAYNLPYGSFLAEWKNPAPAVKADDAGYNVTLQVFPDKLRLGLTFNGEEVKYAYAKVLGDTELDLAKSISYAAHLIYKFVEQDTLK